MITEFHIRTKKKLHKFESVNEMEKFIDINKKFVYNLFIELIDENKKIIGRIKISSYVKQGK